MEDSRVHIPKRRRRPALVVAAVVLVALAVATAALLVLSRAAFTPQGADDAVGVLRNVSAQVSMADETISPMGKLMSQDMSDTAAQEGRDLLAKTDSASQALSEAFTIFTVNKEYLSVQTTREVVDGLEEALGQRQEMLECGKVVLSAAVSVAGVRGDLQSAWDDMVSAAEALTDSATTTANNTSETAVGQALSYDRGAKESLERAQTTVKEVSEQVQGSASSLKALEAYLAKQLEAAEAAIAADNALLANDTEAATESMNAYQTALDQASTLSRAVPDSPDDFVKNIYYALGTDELSVMDAESRYREAAGKAAEADKVVGAYMAERS